MDVFHIDQSLTGTLGGVPSSAANSDVVNSHASDVVTFEAGTEFNLCFFDSTEDTSTQGGFSDDPASPDSPTLTPAATPVHTPLHIQTTPTVVTVIAPGGSDNVVLSSSNSDHTVLLDTSNGALISPQATSTTLVAEVSQEQSHYVAADSNSSSTTKTFVPCKVCGDKASGYHYGVTSCEGCKGFFRRSIQKQIEYRCLRDGKCLVIRLNRNRCQFCRFKKCLAVGMSRDSVRYGRVPKRSRERSTDDTPSPRVSTTAPDVITVASVTPPTTVDTLSPSSMNSNHSNQSTIESESKQVSTMYEVILGISQAHHANCCYTEERTRGLQRRSLVPPPRYHLDEDEDDEDGEGEGVASSTAEYMENDRCWYWQQFATCMTPSVQRVVEFAKRVPGFGGLGQDDQLILIKIGFFEIWLTHIARLTSNQNMMFDDGTMVTRTQLELMYDNDYIGSIIHFVSTFNALTLNDTEIGLFSAVVLMTADRPGVTDVKSIEHNQDKLIDALKVQLARNHTNDSDIFSSLLIKLPELRNLGNKHNSHLDWFRVNWQKLALPPLFAEIFDIPKNDDDIQ